MENLNKVTEIMIRRCKMVPVYNTEMPSLNTSAVTKAQVATMIQNMVVYGYVPDTRLCNAIVNRLNDFSMTILYNDVMETLKSITGADHTYNCMYPNFPRQVMEASEGELFFNAIIHYISTGIYRPGYEKEDRERLNNIPSNYKTLTLCSIDDIKHYVEDIVSGKVSLSKLDFEDIKVLAKFYQSRTGVRYFEIPNKENKANYYKIFFEIYGSVPKSEFNTATDILRLATALSDGDVSLSSNTRFKLNCKARRMIMQLLNSIAINNSTLPDIYKYREKWLRVSEVIHPNSFNRYGGEYKGAIKLFDTLRSNRTCPTPSYNSLVESHINNFRLGAFYEYEVDKFIDLVKSHPGDFARRLDVLLGLTVENDEDKFVLKVFKDRVCDAFKEVVNKVDTSVLLQVESHFRQRLKNHEGDFNSKTVVFPKGNTVKYKIIDSADSKRFVDIEYCTKIVYICMTALINKISEKNADLGKIYIDNENGEFSNFNVPFALRNASRASKILVRGSRVKIPDDVNVIRGFIWWTNISNDEYEGIVDLDLSAVMYASNMETLGSVSYRNLRLSSGTIVHSGDITNGGDPDGEGAAEFMDIDFDKFKKEYPDVRYIAFFVNSYRGQHFNKIPNSCFGWMYRKDLNSGEIFEPSTVELKVDLTQDANSEIPCVFDLETREMIWVDLSSKLPSGYRNDVATIDTESALRAILSMVKPTFGDLTYYTTANYMSNIVKSAKDADTIFTIDRDKYSDLEGRKIITPYDIDYIVSKMM